MATSFMQEIAASLPPEVRRRYARDLEAAERLERALDLAFEIWGHAKPFLGRCCETMAQGLRGTASMFDSAARRLSLRD